MNPLGTLLIHLKDRGRRGDLKTVVRYLQAKSWKYFRRTVHVSVRDREQVCLIMYPGCEVSERLYVVGLYERAGMTTLENLMKPGEVFYDVGANVGPFSLLAHRRGASVYAFEGHPETAERCRQNFMLNGIDAARVLPVAVSDFDGSVLFRDVPGSSINKVLTDAKAEYADHVIEVPAVCLNTFAETHEFPTAVKIDTEGHESAVIRGMRSILRNGQVKYLTFEANGLSSRSDLCQIYEILLDAGFMVRNIDWDRKEFVAKSDLGSKSPTGDYMAIPEGSINLFEQQGVKITKANSRTN